MSEIKIRNGDVITFTALQWEEESCSLWNENRLQTCSPTMLLTPVAHIYEDGIELESVINEALVDVRVDGKLRDMRIEDFLSERGLTLKYLKRIAHTTNRKKKVTSGNYRVLRETYKFWCDEDGKLRYECLGD